MTEGITGANLPSLQLIVAMGIDLKKLPPSMEINKFLVDVNNPSKDNPFDRVNGHTIAVRITAENAADGWKPTVGTIDEISFQSLPSVWGYFSVKTPAAEVHAYADSQFGHIFAHGKDRRSAARLLQLALKRLHVVGEICTNVPYVAELIATEDFVENRVNTGWLDKLIEARMQLPPPDVSHVAICGALLKAHLAMAESSAKMLKESIDRNHCPTAEQLQTLVELKVEFIWNRTKFDFDVYRHSPEVFTVAANGSLVQAKLQVVPGGAFVCVFGGVAHSFHFEAEPGDKLRLTIDGQVVTLEPEVDPSVLTAPYGGKLTKLFVEDGAHVDKGTPFAEVEVMKMLFPLHASEAGHISLAKAPGALINAGEVLARLQLDDPNIVAKAAPYEGELGDFEPPMEMGNGGPPHVQLRYLEARVHHMLDGYVDNEDKVLELLGAILTDASVMHSEFEELMTGAGSKLPQAPREALGALLGGPDEGLGGRVLKVLDAFVAAADEDTALAFKGSAAPLYSFGERYRTSTLDNATGVVRSFVEHFIAIEKFYPDDHSELVGVLNLNAAHEDKATVLLAVLSHSQLERKVSLVLQILDLLGVYTHMDASVLDCLLQLSGLLSNKHARVLRKAKQILANCQKNIAENNLELVLPVLKQIASGRSMPEEEELSLLNGVAHELTLSQPLVLAMLGSSEKGMRKAVAKAAVLLWYSRFGVHDISVKTYLRKGKEKLAVSWSYVSDEGKELEGVLLVFSTMDDLEANFDDLASHTLAEQQKKKQGGATPTSSPAPLPRAGSQRDFLAERAGPAVTMHILILAQSKSEVSSKASVHKTIRTSFAYAIVDEHSTSNIYQKVMSSKLATLTSEGVAQITVLLPDGLALSTFNYDAPHFQENVLLRHILPADRDALELGRLDNFEVERCWFPETPQTHVYAATAKAQKLDTRLFVRTLVLRRPALSEEEGVAALTELSTQELAASINTLEQAIGDSRYKRTESNHLFFRWLAPVCLSVDALERLVRTIVTAEHANMLKLQATELEMSLQLWAPGKTGEPPVAVRVSCRLAPSLSISLFSETPLPGGGVQLLALGSGSTGAAPRRASADSLETQNGSKQLEPYPLLSLLDQKRLRCHKLLTTYAYDWMYMFELAVQQEWEKAPAGCAPRPPKLLSSVELRLAADGSKVEEFEAASKPASNKVGMLAWKVTMCTPEYPGGRDLVLISNDITFANGTFGPPEDVVFQRASEYARGLGIPRIYMAANSGARLGVSDAVKKCFRVHFVDASDPAKGVQYLWLSAKDKEALGTAVVTEAVPVQPGDEDDDGPASERVAVHHKIVAIIGHEEGLGVESLQGASLIAAETSIANREIFTLGYSTARNIGIGSYVLRLGHRVVQQRQAPIILTGYQALNKLLGNDVYESNLQLGGPEVMSGNGIAHLLADSDQQAVCQIVHWLAFVPKAVGAPLPLLPISDPIDRPVLARPTPGTPYDPRQLLCGAAAPNGAWLPGLLDHDSFVETLSDWAKTVVVGRGRLGGMPVGVVVTENRVTEKTVLADPANLESKPVKQMQAGQVWFPDSAYKTAQAIQDLNKGEGLPLLILANWRGFSGGRKDMYEEVLKFGSFIVDQLTQFRQPIIVYIPPHCEIRGGAWVVIDSKINPTYMDMFAAEDSRGGVLEPAGIAEIKFRKPDLIKTMMRNDQQLQWMSKHEASGVVRQDDITNRETELLPSYQPIGELFCDLHDRPERMLAKGVLRSIVPWAECRKVFYRRFTRRVLEEDMVRQAQLAVPGLTHDDALGQLHASLPKGTPLEDDALVYKLLSQED